MFSAEDLLAGAKSGLIKADPDVASVLHPQLILNNFARGEKVLGFVLENLAHCKTEWRCMFAPDAKRFLLSWWQGRNFSF